jgi:hypothetical protein
MAKPEFLEFGAVARSLVINVPSPTWLSPNGQYVFTAAGEEKLAAHYYRIERM